MTPKIFLPVTGFLLFLLTSLVSTQTATANPFGEAFGYISNYSRMFNTGRSYRASRRRRAIRRRIARRRHAVRRRYYARRHRAAIRVRNRTLRARSIRQARLRRNIQSRKRARLARRQLIKRRQSRTVKRRIAQRQRSKKQVQKLAQRLAQKQFRQGVAKQRQARRYRQLAEQRSAHKKSVHKKKNIAARSKSRRFALASVKPVAKRPVTPRVQAKKSAGLLQTPHQAPHKRQLLEQARGLSTYGVQDTVPALVRSEKKGVQLALSQAGFYHGAADGLFGPQTRRAIRDYQKSLGQDRTGHLGSVQLSSLMQAVSRNAKSGNSYLPQDDRKSDRQEKIKKQAKLLAGYQRLPANDSDVFEPKKVSFSKPSTPHKAKPFIAVKPRKLEQQASLQSNGAKNGGSLPAELLQNDTKQAEVTPVDPKAALRVDYVHTLGRTRHGEALWVVKCMDKKQLRLYFWRDKQWWVRGKDGGSVGFSEYGSGGIKNLAGKVCTL